MFVATRVDRNDSNTNVYTAGATQSRVATAQQARYDKAFLSVQNVDVKFREITGDNTSRK